MSVISSLELAYSTYQERQFHAVSDKGLADSLSKAKCSDKFTFEANHWLKHPYPGYAVVSLLDNNPENEKLSSVLQAIQADLIGETRLEDYLFQLPSPSFHQTVANTLSSDRFLNAIRTKGLEHDYPNIVENAFKTFVPVKEQPIRMRIIGISVFGSSLGVLGTFDDETDFNRIIDFRTHFYDNAELGNLGIKCTRPFIGHVTLAYFGKELNPSVLSKLYDKIKGLNEILKKEELYFTMEKTELRKYDELSVFQDSPLFPTVKL